VIALRRIYPGDLGGAGNGHQSIVKSCLHSCKMRGVSRKTQKKLERRELEKNFGPGTEDQPFHRSFNKGHFKPQKKERGVNIFAAEKGSTGVLRKSTEIGHPTPRGVAVSRLRRQRLKGSGGKSGMHEGRLKGKK